MNRALFTNGNPEKRENCRVIAKKAWQKLYPHYKKIEGNKYSLPFVANAQIKCKDPNDSIEAEEVAKDVIEFFS